MAKKKRKWKIVTCKNPKCKQPNFMILIEAYERYCSGDCRFEHQGKKKEK